MIPLIYGLAPIHLPSFFYLDLIVRGKVLPKGRYKGEPISIVIPCHNEEAVIGNTLRTLLKFKKRIKNLEIIVIDDASTDNTFKVASSIKDEHVKIKVFKKENGGKGKSEAVNFGIEKATYDIICILDADSRPHARSLEYLAPYLRGKRVAAACGVIKIRNRNVNWLTKVVSLEYNIANYIQWKKSMIDSYVPWMPGTITLIKKHLAKFPPSLVEDAELSAKLIENGYVIIVDKRAVASEIAPTTLKAYLRQRIRWARGNWSLLKYYRNKKMLMNYFLTFFERIQPALTIISYSIFWWALYFRHYAIDFTLTSLWVFTLIVTLLLYRQAAKEFNEKYSIKTYLIYFFISSFLYLIIWLRSLFPIKGWYKTKRYKDYR
jgi:cellulose synthase/poly-beta-1,6-N-acetylglucosamine synthase-like glycosyltransferase